jgi:salicylate hydroxylase
LLVGADGTRSFVRRQLFDDPAPEFSGQVALRCLIPANAAAPFLSHGNAVVSVGAGRIFHRYALRGGQLINVVGIARSSTWHNEGWNTPATPAEFLDLYQDFHPDVTGLISVAPKDGLIKWGLFVRPPIQHWSAGRVVLLGDAAHPILPFLGLGAALAIEDGIILARVLANGFRDTGELRAFQRTRQSRVERVRVESIRQGEIIQSHDPEGAQLTTSPSQDRSVFDYDPFTAPIELSKIPL